MRKRAKRIRSPELDLDNAAESARTEHEINDFVPCACTPPANSFCMLVAQRIVRACGGSAHAGSCACGARARACAAHARACACDART
eukprot:6014054-Pleurochrysis_carterae.AAC.1